jgi:hypothetical protein
MATATQSKRDRRTERNRDLDSAQWVYAEHYDPAFTNAVESELDRLSNLAKNWDGYGAPRLDSGIIEAARGFVRALPENLAYRPRVVPMSPDNLQFEWHHGSKVLELEFEDALTIHFLQWDPEHGIEEEDTFPVSNIGLAVDLIQWFMSGTLA